MGLRCRGFGLRVRRHGQGRQAVEGVAGLASMLGQVGHRRSPGRRVLGNEVGELGVVVVRHGNPQVSDHARRWEVSTIDGRHVVSGGSGGNHRNGRGEGRASQHDGDDADELEPERATHDITFRWWRAPTERRCRSAWHMPDTAISP